MPASATALDGGFEFGEWLLRGDGSQGFQSADSQLRAGQSGLAGQFPSVDFAIEDAEFLDRFCVKGKTQVGQFETLLGRSDLLEQEVTQSSFVAHHAEAHDLFETQGMGVGASGETGRPLFAGETAARKVPRDSVRESRSPVQWLCPCE